MEYRGIRYTLRAGVERGQWSVVIYPQGVETTGVKVFGTRNDAEDHARRMINRWPQPKLGRSVKQLPEENSNEKRFARQDFPPV
jgi:hypothetical protein